MSSYSQLFGGGYPVWVSGQTYPARQILQSPADLQLYIRTTAAGSGATDPSTDTTNYAPFGARPIKSLQRGVISMVAGEATKNATVTSVNVNKSELRYLGDNTGGGNSNYNIRIRLANATTITADRTAGDNSGAVSWELTEYY